MLNRLNQEFIGMRGFSVQNLWNMRQFYLEYYQDSKLQPLVGEISCRKNLLINYLESNRYDRILQHNIKLTSKTRCNIFMLIAGTIITQSILVPIYKDSQRNYINDNK